MYRSYMNKTAKHMKTKLYKTISPLLMYGSKILTFVQKYMNKIQTKVNECTRIELIRKRITADLRNKNQELTNMKWKNKCCRE